jgi:hypothetical protein
MDVPRSQATSKVSDLGWWYSWSNYALDRHSVFDLIESSRVPLSMRGPAILM